MSVNPIDLSCYGLHAEDIIHNATPARLYEFAITDHHAVIAASGALATRSGDKTGRSPKDKRIVDDPASSDDIWWGDVNIRMTERSFLINRQRALDYLNTRPRIFVFDGYAGWDPKYQIKVRVIAESAYHALFMHNMLIRPTSEQLQDFGDPDVVIFNAGSFPANPYTAQMTGRVDHSLPAALLLWAVLCYRRPLVAGIFLGLAGGLVYYPLFLLPLWGSFYWKRGARKFAAGAAAMILMLVVALSFDSSASLSDHLYRMFGLLKPNRDPQELRGLWALGWNPIWRLPVIVGFAILATFFTIWPARKNLGTLMSSSAALMVAAQFWHGYGGGLYIAWFMPLLLLVIFRPNLQDRIAAKVVAGITPSMAFGETETEPS